MQKTYTVIEIYEADFGCEERPEGQETMVGIRLKAELKSNVDLFVDY